MPNTYTIIIPATGDPSTLTCTHDDTIYWKNDAANDINSFTLPSCVSPQTSFVTLDAGATSGKYTVNDDPDGTNTYHYTFVGDLTADPRAGTIDVEN